MGVMKEKNIFQTMYEVAAFALPVSASGIISMISSFIAMMMVAQLGQEPLAAGALAVTTFITVMTMTATIFYALGILISHHRGQDKAHAHIGLIFKNGVWLAIFMSLPAGLALWHVDKLLLWFGQVPKLVALTSGYFHYAALGMLPLLINAVIAQYYAGTGRPRFTLIIALITLPLTVLASYGFILGHFGFPALGLSGITAANLVVQSVMIVCVIAVMYMRDSKYQLFAGPFAPNWQTCKSIFTLGMPIGIQFGGEIAAMTIATYFMGYFGVTALAASQIVSQYSLFVVMIFLGLSQALSLLISKAYGKHDVHLIKEYLYAAMLILVVCFIVVGILFCLFPTTLVTFYVKQEALNTQLMSLTKIFFIIAVFLLFLDGMRNLLSGALRGLRDSQAPMRVGIITLWFVSLPASYLAGFTLHGGPIGLRAVFVSGFIIASVILWQRLRHKINFIAQEHKNVG